ncbi:MAG: hypothetical protein ACD_8C00124G0014 [uncultured bacterium]|nr:MAG: hypothetical protein ACD_8C00124G0014 [uncultured bacterium]
MEINKLQKNNSEEEIFEFEDISLGMDRCFQIEMGEMITKGFVKTGISKNLMVFVRSGDHNPPHFHIISNQRNIDQKFSIESLENISTIKNHKYDAYIKKYFEMKINDLSKIKNKFFELNPLLN